MHRHGSRGKEISRATADFLLYLDFPNSPLTGIVLVRHTWIGEKDEVVFGMIMMTTVTFGVMTPPVGTALYAVSDIMECPIEETFKKGWPFYLAVVGVILFMIFFPQAVLFLPNLVYGA